MTYNVTISPSGRQFKVDIGTTVLEAALDQGIVLPYGCKDGACGACKSRLKFRFCFGASGL